MLLWNIYCVVRSSIFVLAIKSQITNKIKKIAKCQLSHSKYIKCFFNYEIEFFSLPVSTIKEINILSKLICISNNL